VILVAVRRQARQGVLLPARGTRAGCRPGGAREDVGAEAVGEWWTPDLPLGTAVPTGMPVAVLVSGRTFSSGEALAYHLQARDRVTIVGERTPGAADHVTDIRLAATVTGELPFEYCTDSVTGTNWEGRGVAPKWTAPRTTLSTLRWPTCRY
jgi:C-terminal processing protease CtpA/Prc